MSAYVIHDDWPYNILNLRRNAHPDAEVVAVLPVPSHRPPEHNERFRLLIDEAASTEDWWKLAPEMTYAVLGSARCSDFDVATEGWVTKLYGDEDTTLQPLGLQLLAGEGSALKQQTERSAPGACSLHLASNVAAVAMRLRSLKEAGGSLLVMTGAGMSVSSGVPVFRNSDGTMSADFLRFLHDYNRARARHGLSEAPDWFEFSVPEMFRKETEAEAWRYWSWRILRADVRPSADYAQLGRLLAYFGPERVFVQTSNCDLLHAKAGVSEDSLYEIHGSIRYVQCADECCQELWPVDAAFTARLASEPEWVPRCPRCPSCLRPNVMIFGDDKLVAARLGKQEEAFEAFVGSLLGRQPPARPPCTTSTAPHAQGPGDFAVLEIGAGTVVPSIRHAAEHLAPLGRSCLVRVNPSEAECLKMENSRAAAAPVLGTQGTQYLPLIARSAEALSAICAQLGLPATEAAAGAAQPEPRA